MFVKLTFFVFLFEKKLIFYINTLEYFKYFYIYFEIKLFLQEKKDIFVNMMKKKIRN